MVLWGGLRPIPTRLFLDVVTLLSLCLSLVIPARSYTVPPSFYLVTFAVILTFCTAGLTNRWTISFPLVPFVCLHGLRFLAELHFDEVNNEKGVSVDDSAWRGRVVALCLTVASWFVLFISMVLTVLFPAVELRPLRGKYNVGVVDVHLPVKFGDGGVQRHRVKRRSSVLELEGGDGDDEKLDGDQNDEKEEDGYVLARLLYPTLDKPSSVPYLDPYHAEELCGELMKAGAPGPLKRYGWMLHTWRLTTLRARRNAKPLDLGDMYGTNNRFGDNVNGKERRGLPLAVYSHGLTGNAAIYSYQPLNLAANGTIVLVMEHTDGTAPAVRRRDGSIMLHDTHQAKLWFSGKHVESVRQRRSQTDHRVDEFISSALALLELDRQNIPELESVDVSFVNKLESTDLTFMGHSHGGATALTAAERWVRRRPDGPALTCVVAHEPAVDWMPDDGCRALLPAAKLEGSEVSYNGGTGGYEREEENTNNGGGPGDMEEEKKEVVAADSSAHPTTLHDVEMFFLYSDQWWKNGWGGIPQLRCMFKRGVLGPPHGMSEIGVVKCASHMEFSDTCMLMPTWLGRATGNLGERNPHDTAEEIGIRTLDFIEAVRTKKRTGPHS